MWGKGGAWQVQGTKVGERERSPFALVEEVRRGLKSFGMDGEASKLMHL
jgi:hypothetical protein